MNPLADACTISVLRKECRESWQKVLAAEKRRKESEAFQRSVALALWLLIPLAYFAVTQ